MTDCFQGERIKQVVAGKFHTLFLTGNTTTSNTIIDSGRLFSCGFNKYGQAGISNSLFAHVEEPTEVFIDGLKIKEICAGWHHNLILSEDNRLYGFGARMNGQLDGKNYDGREEQCSIVEIKVPIGETQRISKVKASNLRSYLMTEDGQVWFWGGYFYNNF